jgi:HAMP domain-containing protein
MVGGKMSSYLNPKNWPIMFKISVALLGASLIPVILVAYFNLTGSVKTVETSEYRNLGLLAAATAERLDQLMLDNVIAATQLGSDTEIITLVSDPANAPADVRASVSASLMRILVSNPQYEYVYLLDKNGKVIISRQLDSVPTVEGQAFGNRAYYLETMKGKTYIDVLVGRTSKKLGFYFSAPVLGSAGKPIGVAIIKLKGEAITDIINKFKAGSTGYAFLVDQDGVIVSHPNANWYYHSLMPLSQDEQLKVGQRFMLSGCEDSKNLTNCKVASLNLAALDAAIEGSDVVRNATYTLPSDGTQRIVGLANTKQLNWSVGVDEAKQEFTAPINQLAEQTMLSVLGIGILAVIGGIFLASVITRPIGKLSLAAQAVQRGETSQPEGFAAVMQQGDEVGHLALVFNNMVMALHARVSELHTINMVSRTISSSFNIGNTLTLVLNSLRTVVPYDRALVLLYDPKKDEFYTRATADGRGFHLNQVWDQDDR